MFNHQINWNLSDEWYWPFLTLVTSIRRRQWHPTPVLLPGESHGRRSLVGCSPWGRWGLDTTEWLHFHFSLSCIGEGNVNPFQCSCLENPRDRGAWWAAIYGVAQSRTRLKRLSSSSSSNFNQLKLGFYLPPKPLHAYPHTLSLLLLLLSHFSCVQLCVTPYTAAHQASPSLGFSRQEHWNGLTFPSPMHESEKWKWSR